MLRRQLAGLIVGTMTALPVFSLYFSGLAGPQEKIKSQRPEPEKDAQEDKMPVPPAAQTAREAEVARLVDAFDLTPHPAPPIPDDPPPHEGAMISLPYTVAPPDLMIIEVLDALPGRPISGERLVRPDGTIDIGFYGHVYVRGLTPEQVKVAVLKHLRTILTDEALGLLVPDEPLLGRQPAIQKLPFPEPAPAPLPPADAAKATAKPRSSSRRSRSTPRAVKPRTAARASTPILVPVQRVRSRIEEPKSQQPEPFAPAAIPIKIPVGADGKVTITIEVIGQGQSAIVTPEQRAGPVEMPDDPGGNEMTWSVKPPTESQMVFVDVTAYNSNNYYILGDVLVTGKLPWTGNETVLDALQHAGGLMTTAEPKDIRLVRPARGGKPARVYKVDLASIQERGDVSTNYQLFPNDRLVVGRNDVVKKTVEIDRLNAPIQSISSFMLQHATMLRALQSATSGNRQELLKELVDFWAKESARPGGIQFDEKTLRDAFLRKMDTPPAPAQTAPTPR